MQLQQDIAMHGMLIISKQRYELKFAIATP